MKEKQLHLPLKKHQETNDMLAMCQLFGYAVAWAFQGTSFNAYIYYVQLLFWVGQRHTQCEKMFDVIIIGRIVARAEGYNIIHRQWALCPRMGEITDIIDNFFKRNDTHLKEKKKLV